jgi:glycosyltransferase involved in cell wall biosynthesis
LAEIIILSGSTPTSPSELMNGYDEHCFGLYHGYIKKYGGVHYNIITKFLYDKNDRKIRVFWGLPFLLLRKTNQGCPICALTYPTIIRVFYWYPLILMLRVFGRCKVLAMVHDLPAEQIEGLSGSISLIRYALSRIFDIAFLKLLSHRMYTVSDATAKRISQLYSISPSKISLINNSSFNDLITPSYQQSTKFAIFYSGALMKSKGVNELIEKVQELINEGYDLKLILLGMKFIEIPERPWIFTKHVSFLENLSLMRQASICVIPFPKKIQFLMSVPVKFADYCAAGKPVLSMNLPELTRLIRLYNCGLTFSEYTEMKERIKWAYNHRNELTHLGRNARKLVDEKLNWTNAIEELRRIVLLLEK